MRILGLKPGHDGAVALVEDGQLRWSFESEKDSGPRHGAITADLMLTALEHLDGPPDAVAIGGWHRIIGSGYGSSGAGYFGLDRTATEPGRWNGHDVVHTTTTHERSHILTSLAMAPFAPVDDAAVLVWEGVIGSFYRWSGANDEIVAHPVLDQPGARYAALYALAHPGFPSEGADPPTEYSGKLMALAGCADDQPPSAETTAVVDHLLDRRRMYPFAKRDYRQWRAYDAGVEHPEVARAARYLGARMFARFADVATEVFPAGLPLVIGGGCGLNCDWNRAWVELGHFCDVFVPPCPDDSGSAIGAALGAQVALGGDCHLEWSVYSGPPFLDPGARRDGWCVTPVDADALAARLSDGAVVAWVQGACEIGPRALGHRSLLASATNAGSTARLNHIKARETYRPVAPICRAASVDDWFDGPRHDPYMLYFSRVREPARLPAVTHRDGTARVQALPSGTVPRLDRLLDAVEATDGVPVVCNTSLNFNGRGFINRSADLFDYCEASGIVDAVIDGDWYRRG